MAKTISAKWKLPTKSQMAKALKKTPAGIKQLVHEEIKKPVNRVQLPIRRMVVRSVRNELQHDD
jgi:hypothetical protein